MSLGQNNNATHKQHKSFSLFMGLPRYRNYGFVIKNNKRLHTQSLHNIPHVLLTTVDALESLEH